MGGTFDPIHLGHLRAAETAREGLGLDEVAFLPSAVPPHRKGRLTPATDRYAMVCLATALHPQFTPSDLELRRSGPSYTVDTLAELQRERAGAALFLIVGSDTFPEMTTWRDPEGIFARCTIAVVTRPGRESEVKRAGAVAVGGPSLSVSATAIRERVKNGQSVRYMVPEAVADYITKQGLYR
jgi:nicotinate-nucleotide adenylyltransferase